MRRKDKLITSSIEIDEILERSEICRLGLIDNGVAYIVPVYFAFNDGIIYVHSARKGRKTELLRENNRISFEAELENEIIRGEMPCEWTAKYRSVMGTADVAFEDDPSEKQKALGLIMKKYGYKGMPEFNPRSLSDMVILVLRIRSVSGKQSGY